MAWCRERLQLTDRYVDSARASIHVNGPPGIGKSTLAQMYVDEHPLVLNLDIDQVRCLPGGWRERFGEAGELVRPIALGMAASHLRAGYDVVMPQFLGRASEIERFAAVAHENSAHFAELVVMDTKERSIGRFDGRGAADGLPWHADVKELVGRPGGRNTWRCATHCATGNRTSSV